MPPPYLYWYLKDIQQTTIVGGFTIVTTTDVPCHQWLRHTLLPPQKHAKPVERRGLIVSWDARFCFVAFEDLEQDEPGDTYTHTFTWTGWEICQTRYFYFWATSWSEAMKSTSCIFSKHYLGPPIPTIFYSDAHPEVTSVDGHVAYSYNWVDWVTIRLHPGTVAFPSTEGIGVLIQQPYYGGVGTYYRLFRSIMLFDCSLACGQTVVAAKFHFWGTLKVDNKNINPFLNIYSSTPATNTDLITTDYSKLGTTPLASHINYADFPVNDWGVLNLNAAGLALINATLAGDGIVKIGLREAHYDGPNIEPFRYTTRGLMQFNLHSTDSPDTDRPYLELTYA